MAASPAPAFELAADGGGRFRLSGSFGFETAAAVLARGHAEFARERDARVDLSGVTDADSAGLAVLLAWVERARAQGRTIAFRALPAQLVGIARITHVEPLLAAAEKRG